MALRVQGEGFRVWVLGFQDESFRFGVRGCGLRVWGQRLRGQDLGFSVQCIGVEGLVLMVEG